MNYSLELILRPEVQELLDHFAAVMKVRALFFAADGSPVGRERRQSGNCAFCRLVQGRYGLLPECRALDAQMRAASLASRRIERYFCHAGLCEMITPVSLEGQVAGYIMIGQFRAASQALPPGFLSDPEAAVAWETLPRFDDGELEDLQALFGMLVDYVAARELVGWRADRRRELVEHYLENHYAEDIRLARLARYAGCSVSGLTHWLKEHFGMSFKELLTEKRLRRAEYLLRHEPELSIGEIAARVGYEDGHYFSRIFRRHRGMTPTEMRRR